MKNFLSLFSLKNIRETAQNLWERFPLPAVLLLVNTGFILYQIQISETSDLIMQTILTLVVTFFLATGVALFSESLKTKYPGMQWLHIIPILYGGLFFWSIQSLDTQSGGFNEPFVYFALHLVGFNACLLFAPYILGKKNDTEYTNYFTQVSWTGIMSGIIGGALAALGSIALGAVGTLFEISAKISDWHLYEHWIALGLSLAAPLYALSHLPKKSDIRTSHYDTHIFFSFIIRFIIIPFVFLYFCILYAYSVKVLLNISDWPRGEVSWLVIGFSLFGYIGYIYSRSYEEEYTFVRQFRRYLPFVILPQIPMLGYAIALRIGQYDLTMNRYFVVLFGIWLAGISLYYILSRKKSLFIIPSTLTCITLIISIGPWGVYQLPLTRQYHRLLVNLEKAAILKDGVITPAAETLDTDLGNNIYSGIEYVCQFESCEKIKELFPDIVAKTETLDQKNWRENPYNEGKDYPGINRWTMVSEVTKALNVKQKFLGDNTERKYITLSTKETDLTLQPLDVSGFKKLFIIRVYSPWETLPTSGDYVIINPETEELIFSKDGKQGARFSLATINAELLKEYSTENLSINPKYLTFTLVENGKTIKVLFQTYSIKNPAFTGGDDVKEYANISGYVLSQ